MQLSFLQRQLEDIYELQVAHDVADFVTSDAAVADSLVQRTDSRGAPEQLFIHDDGESLDVTLYIDQEVVDRLGRDDPTEHLHSGNIADFCTALEGVSHFLYLIWHAGYQREVSALELELQAEVDKYVTAAFLFSRQGEGVPADLSQYLFERAIIDTRLDASTQKRYLEANYYARKFCEDIQQRFLGPRPRAGLINEIRRFYRLTRWQKIDHIAASQGSAFRHFVHRH